MGVHGEGVHATNIGVRYVAYFQAIFPMSFRWTQIKVKPPQCAQLTGDPRRHQLAAGCTQRRAGRRAAATNGFLAPRTRSARRRQAHRQRALARGHVREQRSQEMLEDAAAAAAAEAAAGGDDVALRL